MEGARLEVEGLRNADARLQELEVAIQNADWGREEGTTGWGRGTFPVSFRDITGHCRALQGKTGQAPVPIGGHNAPPLYLDGCANSADNYRHQVLIECFHTLL